MNTKHSEERKEIFDAISNIFNGSILLLTVCITIISLFQIMDKRAGYFVDEVLCGSSALFTISMILAYIFLYYGENTMIKKATHAAFILAVGSLIVSGVFLLMQW